MGGYNKPTWIQFHPPVILYEDCLGLVLDNRLRLRKRPTRICSAGIRAVLPVLQ
jgi:hypothetical protein